MPIKRRRRRKKRARRHLWNSVKAGKCLLRSKWELEYLQWLDENTSVVTVSYEKLCIPYISNIRTKKVRRYWPDFVVEWDDGRVEIIEVKPLKRTSGSTVMKKALAAMEYATANGMTYIFVTEVELKSLGLLKRK